MRTVSHHRFLYCIWNVISICGLLCVVFPAHASEPLDSAVTELIKEINSLPQYTSSKEERLDALRKVYFNSESELSAFKAAKELFDEYIYYQSDSAYDYASRMKSLAEKMNDQSRLTLSYLAFMKCFSSNGYFKEAGDMNNIIDPALLSHDDLLDYLRTGATFYQNLESYVGGTSTDLGKIYREKRLGYAHEHISTMPRLSTKLKEPTAPKYLSTSTVSVNAQVSARTLLPKLPPKRSTST